MLVLMDQLTLVEELTAQIDDAEKRIRARIAELDAERAALVALLPSGGRSLPMQTQHARALRGSVVRPTLFAAVDEFLRVAPRTQREISGHLAAKFGGPKNRFSTQVWAFVHEGRLEHVGYRPRDGSRGPVQVGLYAVSKVAT